MEEVIYKSVLDRANGICISVKPPPWNLPITGCEGTASNLAHNIFVDIKEAAKRNDHLYLALH